MVLTRAMRCKRYGTLALFSPANGKKSSSKKSKNEFPSNQKRRGVAKLNKSQCKELLDRPIKERLCLFLIKQKSLSNKKVRFCFLP